MTGPLPTLSINKCFHIGNMDIDQKRSGSYEGNTLSVSQCPESWSVIARLGSEGFTLQKPDGLFLDVHDIEDDLLTEILAWARESGLIDGSTVFELEYLDTETERHCTIEYPSRKEAEDEAEYWGYEDFKIRENPDAIFATEKLMAMSGQTPGTSIDTSFVMDLAVIAWAEANTQLDGLWWEDEFAPDALSAPRGCIFNSRIASFGQKRGNIFDFEDPLTVQEKAFDLQGCVLP